VSACRLPPRPGITGVGGHQDQLAGGHEEGTAAITDGKRIPRREKLRFQAAQTFEQGITTVRMARLPRVSTKPAYQWRRRQRAGGQAAMASEGPAGNARRLEEAQLGRLRAAPQPGPSKPGNSRRRSVVPSTPAPAYRSRPYARQEPSADRRLREYISAALRALSVNLSIMQRITRHPAGPGLPARRSRKCRIPRLRCHT